MHTEEEIRALAEEHGIYLPRKSQRTENAQPTVEDLREFMRDPDATDDAEQPPATFTPGASA